MWHPTRDHSPDLNIGKLRGISQNKTVEKKLSGNQNKTKIKGYHETQMLTMSHSCYHLNIVIRCKTYVFKVDQWTHWGLVLEPNVSLSISNHICSLIGRFSLIPLILLYTNFFFPRSLVEFPSFFKSSRTRAKALGPSLSSLSATKVESFSSILSSPLRTLSSFLKAGCMWIGPWLSWFAWSSSFEWGHEFLDKGLVFRWFDCVLWWLLPLVA